MILAVHRNWLARLRARWGVSTGRVFVILLVFACTGFTVMFLKRPIVGAFAGSDQPLWSGVAYYILILPVYNVILLAYGALFGQFRFFWAFEKRLVARMVGAARRTHGSAPTSNGS
jgi:hypothetical protein